MKTMVQAKVLVLKVSRYSMTDDSTGELVQGTKVTYLQDFDSVEKQNQKGVELALSTMPYEMFEGFSALPAWYNAEFEMSADSKGRLSLRPSKMEYAEAFKAAKG